MKYDSTATNPAISHLQKNNPDAVIRDLRNENPKPLLIINGVPIEDYDILKQIRLVETTTISYLTNENMRAAQFCGYRCLNGVVIIEVSKKRLKEIFKKQSKSKLKQ